MSIDRTTQLKALHLYGMAAAWSEWQTEYTLQQKPVMPEVWLDRLIMAEQADRQARSLTPNSRLHVFPFIVIYSVLIGRKHLCNGQESNSLRVPTLWSKPTI